MPKRTRIRILLAVSGLFILGLTSCEQQKTFDAEDWIEASVSAHGLYDLDGKHVRFDFREHTYTIDRSGGSFTYTRTLNTDSLLVIDSLRSDGTFTRHENGLRVSLPDSMITKYSESINSVAYFFQLPLPLEDAAVISELGNSIRIRTKEYQTLSVRFRQEGGGADYQDEFRYWINKEDSLVDYLAYTYETDGGGIRFRVAGRRHIENGMVFQDYENYKPSSEDTPLDSLPYLWVRGELELLSTIENLGIRVD
jgi:hypothetical protein